MKQKIKTFALAIMHLMLLANTAASVAEQSANPEVLQTPESDVMLGLENMQKSQGNLLDHLPNEIKSNVNF